MFIYLVTFARVTELTLLRREKLNESHRVHQFFRDIDDEEAWIK